MKVRTRFAPSPTGYMHIGNLRTALYAYLFAKHEGGDFILRIEDTDQKRFVEGATEIIYASLARAGLKADESPKKPGKFGPYIQSERKEIYKKYAEQLVSSGDAYYCFCGKEEHNASEHDEDEQIAAFAGYDRKCRNLSKEEVQAKLKAGIPYVIRQKMPLEGKTKIHDEVYGDLEFDNAVLEDQIILKSDGMPTYNFANVIDDHLMQITHVLRGKEYLSSTPKYELLYKALGWESPKTVHLSVVCAQNADGSVSKLSKRHGSVSFEDLVNQGYLPEALVNYIALLGWSPKMEREIFSLDELIKLFSLDGIVRADCIFDYKKLDWMNSQYIANMTDDKFIAYTQPFVDTLPQIIQKNWNFLAQFLKTRISKATEIAEKVAFFYNYDANFDINLLTNKKNKIDLAGAKDVLTAVLPALEDLKDWTNENLNALFSSMAEKQGVKLGYIMWPARLAVSGEMVTPCGTGEIMYVLGKQETLNRIKQTLNRL